MFGTGKFFKEVNDEKKDIEKVDNEQVDKTKDEKTFDEKINDIEKNLEIVGKTLIDDIMSLEDSLAIDALKHNQMTKEIKLKDFAKQIKETISINRINNEASIEYMDQVGDKERSNLIIPKFDYNIFTSLYRIFVEPTPFKLFSSSLKINYTKLRKFYAESMSKKNTSFR